ncbi:MULTISPECIES: LysR family transcriptional regulator [unclassified Rhizobacter]|uniref:LysR family transcriptional regulator n=1 Tax=unclassified Rhizobacter TaxID=2640088 RepID=UPI0006F59714|nr:MULTISPECIES: LysR family transcriptional regulator [unclassified Rhizobacter]KQU71482.1 LysR family transcriptional regulator [Rhizobacter sp. Root29]KQW13028.1 LysR family transcriptional regulator [Rhizobacter sp. Root1238]KRB10880.1 LysR family transcriptional regulator [Rhizobacter sp. Root16D2]
MDRFTSMTMFARVVECGSFAAAAQGSGMTPTMVGNHVRELERHLNGRLLNRTTRRQSLTELGRRYHAQCVEIIARVEAAELDAREMQTRPRGRLRVSCPVIYGTRALVPVLASYLDRYPEVQVELSLSDRFVDLAEEGFDAAIRVGELPDSGLVARPLRPSQRIACASPAYLARHGTPQVPADLAQHNCLALLFATGPERDWRFPRPDGSGVEHITVRGRFDVSGGMALREAALAGLGVILQPELMLKDDIETGRLVRLFSDWPPPTWPVHVMHLPDVRMPPKLGSFIAFLQETLGRR